VEKRKNRKLIPPSFYRLFFVSLQNFFKQWQQLLRLQLQHIYY
jgi:hypothetical protein